MDAHQPTWNWGFYPKLGDPIKSEHEKVDRTEIKRLNCVSHLIGPDASTPLTEL
jgi:hypothetical protein